MEDTSSGHSETNISTDVKNVTLMLNVKSLFHVTREAQD
jgi:hypothetical protein